LAGDTAKQKGFRPFNASLIIGAIAIKRLRSSSRRDGVFDPIAVSRLDQKKTSQRPLRLCGEPDFEMRKYQSKSPMKSTEAAINSGFLGQQ